MIYARDPDYDDWFADNLSREETDWDAADQEAYRALQVEREICAAEIAHAKAGDRSGLPALLAKAKSLCMASLRLELGV